MNLHTKRRLKAGVALLCSATMTFALATPYSFADEKETLENKTSDLQSQLAGSIKTFSRSAMRFLIPRCA